jgi:hypothetical protein
MPSVLSKGWLSSRIHHGAVLIWAGIFASTQQLVTRVMDRKASALAAASADLPTPDTEPASQILSGDQLVHRRLAGPGGAGTFAW